MLNQHTLEGGFVLIHPFFEFAFLGGHKNLSSPKKGSAKTHNIQGARLLGNASVHRAVRTCQNLTLRGRVEPVKTCHRPRDIT